MSHQSRPRQLTSQNKKLTNTDLKPCSTQGFFIYILSMIIPGVLKRGDKIGILAPARKISPSDVEHAVNIFELWGLKVNLSENIFSNAHSYLSGSDLERLTDFQGMINDNSYKAIICSRGGYGSTRIIDALDFSSLRRHAKWIIGFSDITAIHLRLFKENIVSIHGIMPIQFSKSDSGASIESLRKLLLEGECKIEIPAVEHNRLGETSGQVVGGNLSLILDSLGTTSEPDTRNKILVIEEIDEPLYKVDRMLTQLRRAGKLNALKGLIIGHLTDIRDTELSFGETVKQIISNAVKDYSYPVCFDFPSGHEHPNLAWIHGGSATFISGATSSSLNFKKILS